MNLPDGRLSDDEALELRRLATGKLVLELGSWKGRSTVAMTATAEKIWAVDRFTGDEGTGREWVFPEFWSAVMAYAPGKVIPCVGEFADVLPMLSVDQFGFVFIDGDHSHEQTIAILRHVVPRVHVGVLVAMHDWSTEYPGVISAVNQCGRLRLSHAVDSLGVFRTVDT